MNRRKSIWMVFVGLSWSLTCFSQVMDKDTLNASVITDVHRGTSLSRTVLDGETIRFTLSPIGEGDVVKQIQALPGVTAGADAFSAFYVRGGSMGGNLMSLDGVPLYGKTHLLGLTSVFPTALIEKTVFEKGGFNGRYGNYTSSHLNILTKNPAKELTSAELTVNPFICGADVSLHTSHHTGLLLSGRLSPVSIGYKTIRPIIKDNVGLTDFSAGVWDLFAKITSQIGEHNQLMASVFWSSDQYSLAMQDETRQRLGWNNLMVLLMYRFRVSPHWHSSLSLSYHAFDNHQSLQDTYREQAVALDMVSGVGEVSFRYDNAVSLGRWIVINTGLDTKYAFFHYGPPADRGNNHDAFLVSPYLDMNSKIGSVLEIGSSIRENVYRNIIDKQTKAQLDASISLRGYILPSFYLEGTVDKLSQFYHNLEGLPIGWPMDIYVPSGNGMKPETALQFSISANTMIMNHSFLVGGFYKKIDNLAHLVEAGGLWSSAALSWKDNVDMGEGLSKGVELMYSFLGPSIQVSLNYTLSETTRMNFERVNNGLPFHARYDRTHVFHGSVNWKGLSATFSIQSGHWENGAPSTYNLHLPDGQIWTGEFYSSINNYRMPTYVRLDLGYRFQWGKGRMKHSLNLGVTNLFNRFNPSFLFYNTRSEKWNELATMRILPTFNYVLRFSVAGLNN